MANFSDEELELIQNAKLPTKALPKYFSAAEAAILANRNDAYHPISRDFEAYLILQTDTQKQSELAWIKRATTILSNNEDRDALLTKYYENRNADASLRVQEIDTVLSSFDSYRVGLLAQGDDTTRFASVIEVSLMANSLQRPIDEIQIYREQAFHEQTLISILKQRLDVRKDTADTKEELKSWQSVITTYPGRANAAGAANNPPSTIPVGAL